MGEMRLQKFLAISGVASRRKAEELIALGRVEIDGRIAAVPGVKVDENSIVMVDGKIVTVEDEKVYIMLNKPEGYISSAKDQFSRKTALDLVQGVKQRIYPVGRLDYDTSGLLLLTNDGDFTYKLTHPKHDVKKVYIAELDGIPDEADIKRFSEGLEIDGYATSRAELTIIGNEKHTSAARIILHEGRNRQIKKMCTAIGHPVLKLKRVMIGGLQLGDLAEGEWRRLDDCEISNLLNV